MVKPRSLLYEAIFGVLLFYLTPKYDFFFFHIGATGKKNCINFTFFSQYPASSIGGSGKLL